LVPPPLGFFFQLCPPCHIGPLSWIRPLTRMPHHVPRLRGSGLADSDTCRLPLRLRAHGMPRMTEHRASGSDGPGPGPLALAPLVRPWSQARHGPGRLCGTRTTLLSMAGRAVGPPPHGPDSPEQEHNCSPLRKRMPRAWLRLAARHPRHPSCRSRHDGHDHSFMGNFVAPIGRYPGDHGPNYVDAASSPPPGPTPTSPPSVAGMA
jgi:hypothetical protein